MSPPKDTTVVLRPKRQITLPKDICESLGIEPGDALDLVVEKSVLKAFPRKLVALDALREIQDAYQRSGISEKDLLREGARARQELSRERRRKK
jgi:AbrB family looped-hinge helix DNA binding protein